MQASTITMVSRISTVVNIELAYHFLSVMHPRNTDGSRFIHPKSTRDKIPFFGVNGAIVCLKYKGKIRGIRQNESQMNNVVSVDLQIHNKNVNIKLAKTNLQLTGASSEQMGNDAFSYICGHINMVQTHLNYAKSLNKETLEGTFNWLCETLSPSGLKTPPGTPKNAVLKPDIELLNKAPSLIDKNFALFLWQYIDDFDNIEDFISKITSVMNVIRTPEQKLVTEEVRVLESRISNSVFNYAIKRRASLIALSKFLLNKGFSVGFHTWNSAQLKVTIPIIDEEEDMDEEGSNELDTSTVSYSTYGNNTKKKIRAHRFSVSGNDNMSVKMTSPSSYVDALEAQTLFLDSVYEFLDSDLNEYK